MLLLLLLLLVLVVLVVEHTSRTLFLFPAVFTFCFPDATSTEPVVAVIPPCSLAALHCPHLYLFLECWQSPDPPQTSQKRRSFLCWQI